MVVQTNLLGIPTIGVYLLPSDRLCLVPAEIPESKVAIIKRELNVPIYSLSVGGSRLLGVMAAGNSKGIAVPHVIRNNEYKILKNIVGDMNISILDCKWTALGNLILVNDRGCLVDPRLPSSFRRILGDTYDVEVAAGTIGSRSHVGSLAVATNKGGITSPLITDEEKEMLDNILKIKSENCTVNGGFKLPKCGVSANTNGVLVGSSTRGRELAILIEALGF